MSSIDQYKQRYDRDPDQYDNVIYGWKELMRLGPREDGVTIYSLTLKGDHLRDYFSGDRADDFLYGGGGDDLLYGGGGDDLVHGGDGDDFVDGAGGNDKVYGGNGNDFVDGARGNDEAYGGAGADFVDGGRGDDEIYGGNGNDFLNGGWGDDTLEGGLGNDTLDGSWGADVFVYRSGDFGADVITGFKRGEDKLDFRGSGLSFSDLKITPAGNHSILVDAGSGNQIKVTITGRGVGETASLDSSDFLFDPVSETQRRAPTVPIVDDDGPPEVSISDATVTEGGTAQLTLELSRASDRDVSVYYRCSGEGDAICDVDYLNVTGGQYPQVVFKAGETSKVITVNTMDDTEQEGDESFSIELFLPEGVTLGSKSTATVTIVDDDAPSIGGEGANDLPTWYSGEPVLPEPAVESGGDGGAVSALGVVTGTRSADTLDGGADADDIECRGGDDIARGQGGADRLWGGAGKDILYGNAGADSLYGGAGADTLYGGRHGDTLFGGSGADTLYGGAGADRLEGGAGHDILYGGDGSDRFVYGDEDFGRDRIGDFEDGKDLLDFTGSRLSWSDISVSDNGKGDAVVRIEGTGNAVVLEGVDAALIGQDDFLFS